jgi:hypothetical protein
LKIRYILLFLISSIYLNAQSPNIEWQKCYGGYLDDEGFSICKMKNGGFAIAGYSYSTDLWITNHIVTPWNQMDFWLVNIGEDGIQNWNKCYGGTQDEEAYSIKQTYDAGFILAGKTVSSDSLVQGIHGPNFDYWIIKVDSIGGFQWQYCLGGTQYDYASEVIQTLDSGYLVVGGVESSDGNVSGFHGGEDFWVAKLNASGIYQWGKSLGGSGYEHANSCVQLPDSNFLIAGGSISTDGDVVGNHNGSEDSWVVKLNKTGNILWNKCYGGSDIDYCSKILLSNSNDKSFFICGATFSNNYDVSGNHGSNDFWICKIDSGGNIIWTKCYGGLNPESAKSACVTSDGGLIITGNCTFDDGMVSGTHGGGFFDWWVAKIDSLGNFQWGKCLGGTSDDEAQDVLESSDGGYVIAGYTLSNDGDVSGNHNNRDVWVVKLASPTLSVTQNAHQLMDLIVRADKNRLVVNFFSKTPERLNAEVVDMYGRHVLSSLINCDEGINQFLIYIDEFYSGIYFLQLSNSNSFTTTKFLLINN